MTDVVRASAEKTLIFDTLDILAAAVAAFEHNKGYIKSTMANLDPNDPNKTIYTYANKDILKNQFLVDYYSMSSRPPLMKITDEHRQTAVKIKEYSKKEIFNLISSEQPAYGTSLYECLNKEKAGPYDFGFIASAPFYYENGKNKDFFKEKINSITSNHFGAVGSKVILSDFEIIKNNKSVNYPGNVIMGICDGNLFLFFTRNHFIGDRKVGSIISIEGIVKDHIMEQGVTPMTKLNRVYERPAATLPENLDNKDWSFT